jgi:Transglutaminase-like superfamily
VTSRPGISDLRAGWWAYRCLRNVRRRLAAGEPGICVPPPRLPAAAVRGVEAVLRRARPTCLEAALVRQRWLAAHGVLRDVVVGVTAPSDGFRAHAWLEDPSEAWTHPNAATGHHPWHELTRLTA